MTSKGVRLLSPKGLNVCFPYVPLMNSSSDKKPHCNGVFSAGKTKKLKPFGKKPGILLTVALFVFMLFVTFTVRPAYSKEGTAVETDGITLGVSPSNIIDYSLGPGGKLHR